MPLDCGTFLVSAEAVWDGGKVGGSSLYDTNKRFANTPLSNKIIFFLGHTSTDNSKWRNVY